MYEGCVLGFWSQDRRGGEKIDGCAKAGLLQANRTKDAYVIDGGHLNVREV
jgi:hypothetical protein